MKKCMRKKRNKVEGFTLAELLIVVAIIGILVAVSIPIFTNRLAKAREATCLSNTNSLKHHIVVDLLEDETKTPVELLKELQTQDDAYCPEGGTYSIDPSDGTLSTGFNVVCSKHGAKKNLGDDDTRNTVLNVLKGFPQGMDSGAGDVSDQSQTAEFEKKLKEAGLDLKELGAASWKWYPSGETGFLYWTTVDISKLQVGTQIPVMRYNTKTGTFTVWITTIGTGKTGTSDKDYNIIGGSFSGYTPSTGSAQETQTYANMVRYFEEAMKQYNLSV